MDVSRVCIPRHGGELCSVSSHTLGQVQRGDRSCPEERLSSWMEQLQQRSYRELLQFTVGLTVCSDRELWQCLTVLPSRLESSKPLI